MEVKRNGTVCGSASLETRGLYVSVRVEYRVCDSSVLRAYLRGDRGTVRLGVPVPERGGYVLRRDMTAHEISAAGTPLEVLLLAEGESGDHAQRGGAAEEWRPLERPERFFSWGESALAGRRDCLWRGGNGVKSIALPYSADRPFPLVRYFCFARIETISGKRYAVYTFDGREEPVLR